MTGESPSTTGPSGAPDLLARVADGTAPAFALLYRPEVTGQDTLEVLLADAAPCPTLADLPLPDAPAPGGGHEVLALVPYRQIAERGFAARDDGEQLIAMTITEQQQLSLGTALGRLPNDPVKVVQGAFDMSDEEYADLVRRVLTDEIGTGEGANFVIKRAFTAWLPGFSRTGALSFFRRLLERETGAYWTFLVCTGDRVLVGASPEYVLYL